MLIEGGRIRAVGPARQVPRPPAAREIGAQDAGPDPVKELLLLPGFIDLQLNGGLGHDFTSEPAALWRVAAELPRYGVTAFLPTLVSSPEERVTAARAALARGAGADWRGAIPLGLHLEGPFLNPAQKGAHDPAHLRSPTPEAVVDWSPERGVRLVTLAPELPGASATIERLTQQGVVVGAGHSSASYAETQRGLAAGLRYGTHLFNGMPPLGHREPGLVGALLEHPGVTLGLIADGIHVHRASVALVWRLLGGERLNLVSDGIAALGMPPGRYRLGDLSVVVAQGEARLADGTLAGSTLTPDAALRNLMAFTGSSLTQALPTLTHTPATLLGLAGERGQIAPGRRADLVLTTRELRVVMTIVGGKVVYSKEGLGKL